MAENYEDFDQEAYEQNEAAETKEREQEEDLPSHSRYEEETVQRDTGGKFRKKVPQSPQSAIASASSIPRNNPERTPPPARYVPYKMPNRIGILDRQTNTPLIEDVDILEVLLAAVCDLKNDIAEIKSFY